MTTSNIKLFAIALSFISILFSCSGDEMNGERTLRITDGSDLEADDSLVLPYQTTGSFLTMDCRWLQKEGYTTNVVGCRLENKDGEKLGGENIDLRAFQGDKLIDSKISNPDSGSYWSRIVTLGEEYSAGIDIGYFQQGVEVTRESVERLLLFNKGIRSVRVVDNEIPINASVLDGLGLGRDDLDPAIRFAVSAGSQTLLGGDILSKEGVVIKMKKSAVWSETYCTSDGRNRIAPTNDFDNYPHFYNRDPSLTTYYYDPRKIFTKYIPSALRNFPGVGSYFENLIDGLVDWGCSELTTSPDGTKNYLATKCYNKPERILSEPILHRNGFCLQDFKSKDEVGRCGVAVFENPSEGTDQYFMAFGKERVDEITSDLSSLNIDDAVDAYLRSFEKCESWETKDK